MTILVIGCEEAKYRGLSAASWTMKLSIPSFEMAVELVIEAVESAKANVSAASFS